jgi:Integrase core domain
VIGVYKTELIHRRGPWRSLEQVELGTAEWVDWWNQRRPHSAIDTCRRPSSSGAGGSKGRLPDVLPPPRRLGGEKPRSGTAQRGSTTSPRTIVSARQALPSRSKPPSLQETQGNSWWTRQSASASACQAGTSCSRCRQTCGAIEPAPPGSYRLESTGQVRGRSCLPHHLDDPSAQVDSEAVHYKSIGVR